MPINLLAASAWFTLTWSAICISSAAYIFYHIVKNMSPELRIVFIVSMILLTAVWLTGMAAWIKIMCSFSIVLFFGCLLLLQKTALERMQDDKADLLQRCNDLINEDEHKTNLGIGA